MPDPWDRPFMDVVVEHQGGEPMRAYIPLANGGPGLDVTAEYLAWIESLPKLMSVTFEWKVDD